jgi:hypothetical protein
MQARGALPRDRRRASQNPRLGFCHPSPVITGVPMPAVADHGNCGSFAAICDKRCHQMNPCRRAAARFLVTGLSLTILFGACSVHENRSAAGLHHHSFIAYWPPPKSSQQLCLAVKDNIDVKGVVTTAGSEYVAKTNPPATRDAECLAIARKRNVRALPTLQVRPPLIPWLGRIALLEARVLNLQNTVAVNFAGNPALAVPVPLRHEPFPVTSLQLVGTKFSEAELLNAGRLVEAAVVSRKR